MAKTQRMRDDDAAAAVAAALRGIAGRHNFILRVWNPFLDLLRERGLRHEHGDIEHLGAGGREIETIPGIGIDPGAVAATAEAMRRGRAVIVQGAFLSAV
jgi:hypothetical protein